MWIRPTLIFPLLNLRKNNKKCSSLNLKTCSNPQAVIIDQFSFYYIVSINWKVFFKIKYFLGNQIEATKEEIKVLVS